MAGIPLPPITRVEVDCDTYVSRASDARSGHSSQPHSASPGSRHLKEQDMSTPGFSGVLHRVPHARLFIALVIALAAGTGAYAYTASNTVPNSTAGSGQGTVSGYTVTNVHYVLNTTTPANIDSLTFTVSPVIPSTSTGKVIVQAQLSTGGPTNYTCT